jgi:hypothetical protein
MDLTFSLNTLDIHVSGKPVTVDFTLENATPADLWVLKWYTPFEGIKGKIFSVCCDGIEMEYQGRMVKRAEPRKEDYLFLKSGESETVTVDLTEVYPIRACKKCRVTFRGSIYDTAESETEVPRLSEKHRPIPIKGNSLIFPVLPESK